MSEKERTDLFRQASKLLGDDAGIENDPYGMPGNQGEQPPEDKTAYLDWATEVRRWYRFRPGGDATLWRLHAAGCSVREIDRQTGLDFSRVAARIRELAAQIKAAEKKRSERPRTMAGLVAEADPLFLIQLLGAV